ncbi:hypothetical protein [Streptomyces mobaraensis]|uniref:Uncharacterized protein n=1 Tax=Streptomyces mobaraensis TaxID=35621 RepID=A0A5N5WD24_STRMB|nr:hypothetical protein [Streptomyces mobaraensis]KAB7850173.1 hypothetical protein FRZ00_06130 [Streptomyces mobaraensis]
MIHLALISAGFGLTVVSVALDLSHRCRRHHADGLRAVGNALISLGNLPDYPVAAVITGAVAAWCAHRWWHGGGGDGTRRGLRDLRRRFTAVRRTAPVA